MMWPIATYNGTKYVSQYINFWLNDVMRQMNYMHVDLFGMPFSQNVTTTYYLAYPPNEHLTGYSVHQRGPTILC